MDNGMALFSRLCKFPINGSVITITKDYYLFMVCYLWP